MHEIISDTPPSYRNATSHSLDRTPPPPRHRATSPTQTACTSSARLRPAGHQYASDVPCLNHQAQGVLVDVAEGHSELCLRQAVLQTFPPSFLLPSLSPCSFHVPTRTLPSAPELVRTQTNQHAVHPILPTSYAHARGRQQRPHTMPRIHHHNSHHKRYR
jgi:hypothetical protein